MVFDYFIQSDLKLAHMIMIGVARDLNQFLAFLKLPQYFDSTANRFDTLLFNSI